MIVQGKETKSQASLLDLLGGSGKKESSSNDVFSQLLATLQGKTDPKSSARGKGFEALLTLQNGTAEMTAPDPKKGRIVSGLAQNFKNLETKTAETASPSPLSKELRSLVGGEERDTAETVVPSRKKGRIVSDLMSNLNADESKTTEKASPSPLSKELRSLLGGEERAAAEVLVAKELLSTLSADQVKTLIHRAKDYLKNEIATRHPEYLNDEKVLPKTLIGLVQLAEKLDLKPASITLEMLIPDPAEQQPFSQPLLSKTLMDTKAVAQLPVAATDGNGEFEMIRELLGKGRSPAKTEEGTVAVFQKNPEDSSTQPLQSLLQSMQKKTNADKPSAAVAVSETVLNEIKPIDIKSSESKTAVPSHNGNELLTLLHGGSASGTQSKEEGGASKVELTAEKLLHAPKADAIEVKAKEAQQSMRLFATDLKEAVENYKPPFTRLTMKLNPEKLGEVEVTLVQRGNNVHVNIQSSNANSIAFLAHNATELKAQLAQHGITNATMNFMAGGDGQMPQNQQQQHNRFRAYASFEELEMNEEALSALELIIPQYA